LTVDVTDAETGVDAGLRRPDGREEAVDVPTHNVTPAKAGAHASFSKLV
jgi:hypothetical protein